MYRIEEDEMYTEINRIAQQHIADLQAEAANARLAKTARQQRPRVRALLSARPKATKVAARPAYHDAH
jgi:hypothetical protein